MYVCLSSGIYLKFLLYETVVENVVMTNDKADKGIIGCHIYAAKCACVASYSRVQQSE